MNTQEAYQEWHPEHKVLKWVKGAPLKKGSVLYSEEYLGDNLQKIKIQK